MGLPVGLPGFYGTYNDQTLNQAVQETYVLAFGKKVGMTLTHGGSLTTYSGQFTSVTILTDNVQFTIVSEDELAGSDTNTSAITTWKAGMYICGKFKQITTAAAGSIRIN